MKRVTILGLTDTSSTIMTGPMDIFFYAGRLWNALFLDPLPGEIKDDWRFMRIGSHLFWCCFFIVVFDRNMYSI